MAKAPILPKNRSDPTGVDRLERGAMRQFKRRIRKVAKVYEGLLDQIPASPVVNRSSTESGRYEFRLDPYLLSMLLNDAASATDNELLEGGEHALWFSEAYVKPAYQRGTAQAHANLAHQSSVYKAGSESLPRLLVSDAYRTRMALIQARQFEEMKGLSSQVKTNMSRVLTDGIGRGLNPRKIAKNLTEQAGIETRRANRIARTEITTALRRARMDEADDAAERYGLRTMQMHISALSPTTRASHAARHGHLYTTDEERDWWSRDGNSINCYVPGTRVQGRFLAGSKAKYRGPVIEIVTASGRSLTVTPNHPVLTSAGMIPAAEIGKGDYAVAYSGEAEDFARVGPLDDEKVEPVIEQVFGALVEAGHSLSARVGTVDFHGDASFMDEDIDIVRADRELVVSSDPMLGKHLDDLALIHANSHMTHFGCSLCPDGQGVDLPPASLMCRLNKFLTETLGGGSILQICGLFVRPLRKSSLGECSDYRRAGEASFFAQLLDCLPIHVLRKKLMNVVRAFHCPLNVLRDSEPFQVVPNSIGANAVSPADCGWGGPVAVFLDQVVDVRCAEYSGHVFDLEEVSGLMVANGVIASNCKCGTVEVLVDENNQPLVPDIVKRAKQTKKLMEQRGNGPWARRR